MSLMFLKPLWLIMLSGMIVSGQSLDKRDQDFWNDKFKDPNTQFNRTPSRLMVDALRGRHPGRALDLGMGEGRNVIYLAMQGWQVTGVDISDIAVGQAKAKSDKLHLKLNAVVDDLEHYNFGKEQWDLITLLYMHSWYRGTKPASTKRILTSLKPGGLLVIEGFAGLENYMFQPNELLRDFPDLRVLRYEDTQGEAEWAPGKVSHIIRFVAEKSR